MKIKAVIFDKDGVLVDFEKTWVAVLLAIAKTLSDADRQLEEQLLTAAGYDAAAQRFKSGSVWAAGNNADLVSAWHRYLPDQSASALEDLIQTNCLNTESVPLHGIESLQRVFKQCRQLGLKLGIATNDSYASATRAIKAFGLDDHLDLIIGYDSILNPKPASDPIDLFSQSCDLKNKEIAMVGDNLHDIEMGKNAGVHLTIGVLSGNSSREELFGYADVILDSVLDVPGFLVAESLV